MTAMTVTARPPQSATTPAHAVERAPRVGLAKSLVIVALIAATLWWLFWAAAHSILSDTRSEAIGAALVDDATVRTEVIRQVRDGMYLSGATSLGFSEEDLDAAAADVSTDPSVGPAVAERVAAAHRRALEPSTGFLDYSTRSDDQVFVAASIRALEARRPDITIPDLQWMFTTTVQGGFPDLSGPSDQADRWRTPALFVAVGALIASAAVHPDRRPRRWLARWCLTAGVLTLAAPILLQMAAGLVGGDSASVMKAIGVSLKGTDTRRGAMLLVLAGALMSLGTWAKAVRAPRTPRPPSAPPRMPTGPIQLGGRASTGARD